MVVESLGVVSEVLIRPDPFAVFGVLKIVVTDPGISSLVFVKSVFHDGHV